MAPNAAMPLNHIALGVGVQEGSGLGRPRAVKPVTLFRLWANRR